MANKVKNLLGQRFGMLTVIERAENIGDRAAWLCKCDCGGTKIVRSSNLQKGKTQSCGCKHKQQLEQLLIVLMAFLNIMPLQQLLLRSNSEPGVSHKYLCRI